MHAYVYVLLYFRGVKPSVCICSSFFLAIPKLTAGDFAKNLHDTIHK